MPEKSPNLLNITVIQGSVLETEILDEANIQTEVIIAVTDNDETNVLALPLAKDAG